MNGRVRSPKNSYKLRNLQQERIYKANPRSNLTTEYQGRLFKLKTIASKLMRAENLPNRQLQTCQSDDEYAQLQAE